MLAILHGVSRRMQETLLSIINEVSIYEKGRAACRTKRTPICKTINEQKQSGAPYVSIGQICR